MLLMGFYGSTERHVNRTVPPPRGSSKHAIMPKKKRNASCRSPGLDGSSGWWQPVASRSEHRAGVGYAAAGAGAGLAG